MYKCIYFNPYKYEFLFWFFLGIGLTAVFCLITVSIPQFRNFDEIIKSSIEPIVTIMVAITSIIIILCQMQQKEETQKQTNTLQLIDSLLYQHFQNIFKAIEKIESKTKSKIKKLSKKMPIDEQYDNTETPDAIPNKKSEKYNRKKEKIEKKTSKQIHKELKKLFDFIYDIEIKIEQNIVNEELIKLYFKEPIYEILARNYINELLHNSPNKYSEDKKKKINQLSKRWYDDNFFYKINNGKTK